ncbi:MAG TPA: hypothetical protein VN666_21760 [Nitrospira sp.]|nr:hypothetical protein [Nitrospira sp.]
MKGGRSYQCPKGGQCSWHVPAAARETMSELVDALTSFTTLVCNMRDLYNVPAAKWFAESETWKKSTKALQKAGIE